MHQPTREQIFELASEKMRAEFQELESVPHAGAKGSEAERILREFLNRHLPRRFAAGAGFIIDHLDNVSKQHDVVVYDAMNCPVYRASDDAAIFPADNVVAVVEVKSRLDKERLDEAFSNIESAKSLAKTVVPETGQLVLFETMGIVFAFDSILEFDTLADHYKGFIRGKGLGKHVDFVFVLDRGMLCLSAKPRGEPGWAPIFLAGSGGAPGEGCHIAVAAQPLARATLDAFIRTLLGHLQFFRHTIDHPGFNWGGETGAPPVRLTYLTSLTQEKDPARREERLREYRAQAIEEMSTEAPPPAPK